MVGITSDPEITPKIKNFIDNTFFDLCKKYKSPELHAGFEIFRNEVIFRLKHEKLAFTKRRN